MSIFYVDLATSDLDFSSGTVRWTEDIVQITAQRILASLQTIRGTWYANTRFGFPLVANENNPVHLMGSQNKSIVDSYIKEVIMAVPNVAAIENYKSFLKAEEGVFEGSATVRLVNGETVPITFPSLEI